MGQKLHHVLTTFLKHSCRAAAKGKRTDTETRDICETCQGQVCLLRCVTSTYTPPTRLAVDRLMGFHGHAGGHLMAQKRRLGTTVIK